jgi:hypothetical protein
MAKAILPAALNDPPGVPLEIDLKEPWVAALLAWLVPGLGHLYQGRVGKGMLFFICVLGTFVFGLVIGEGKVVYASTSHEEPWRWQFYCQLGVGVPAMPALVQRHLRETNQPVLWNGFMAPPIQEPVATIDASGNQSTQPNELAKWTVDMHPRYELGTVYTVIAGLLNILVICDAFAGPLLLVPKKTDAESEPAAATEKPAAKPATKS